MKKAIHTRGPVQQRTALYVCCAFALIFAGFVRSAVAAESYAQARNSTTQPAVSRVTDDTGRIVNMPRRVQRIVSLAPSVTETLFALGLGDRVVGDTNYCDYPAEAKSKPHVGAPLNPSLEQIAALHPDLVVATRLINRESTVASLERLGITVYATDARTVEQVLTSTDRLALLLQAGQEGARVVAENRRRFTQLRDRLAGIKPVNVFFVVWQEPLISIGNNTFVADALRWAGAQSVLQTSQDWPNVSLEAVVRLQPEYLIFSSDDRELVRRQIADLRNRSGWRDMEALRRDKVIIIGEGITHPSPRLIEATEELARALHPERLAAAAPYQAAAETDVVSRSPLSAPRILNLFPPQPAIPEYARNTWQ